MKNSFISDDKSIIWYELHCFFQYIGVYTKNIKINEFKNDLKKPEIVNKFSNILDTDSNHSYNNLNKTLRPLMDKHFPVKYAKFNKYKHKQNDWITNGILRSISFRDKLYTKCKSTSAQSPQYTTLQENLKTYNKILKQSIHIAKKSFFVNCFDNYRSDMKKNGTLLMI